jgi:hypothetical protein
MNKLAKFQELTLAREQAAVEVINNHVGKFVELSCKDSCHVGKLWNYDSNNKCFPIETNDGFC